MKTPLIVLALIAASAAVASADPVDPLDAAPTVSVGSFAYTIDGYLSSTPAILSGLDAAYDHALTGDYGLRFRAGAILVGVDEITGVAPHAEAGAFRRLQLGPRLALDAALLAGYHFGGLDHKQEWEDHAGPTAVAELALYLAVTDHLQAAVGGGYRLAWTADEHVTSDESDPFSSGPLLRMNLGWSF